MGGGWRRRGFTDTRAPGKRRGEEKKSRSGPEVMLGSIKHCTGLWVLLASPLIGSPSGSSSYSFSVSPSSDSSSFFPPFSSSFFSTAPPLYLPFFFYLFLCLPLILLYFILSSVLFATLLLGSFSLCPLLLPLILPLPSFDSPLLALRFVLFLCFLVLVLLPVFLMFLLFPSSFFTSVSPFTPHSYSSFCFYSRN